MQGSLTSSQLAEGAAVCAGLINELADLIGKLARLAGMNAIAHADEFARTWRDMQTLAAHFSVSPLHWSRAGGVLLSAGTH